MTVSEALKLAGAMRASELGEETLTALLLGLEAELALEVRGERLVSRAVTCTDLAVPAPFDRIYWTYLVAMTDLALGNHEGYVHSLALYRESREAYARWYQRTVGQGG